MSPHVKILVGYAALFVVGAVVLTWVAAGLRRALRRGRVRAEPAVAAPRSPRAGLPTVADALDETRVDWRRPGRETSLEVDLEDVVLADCAICSGAGVFYSEVTERDLVCVCSAGTELAAAYRGAVAALATCDDVEVVEAEVLTYDEAPVLHPGSDVDESGELDDDTREFFAALRADADVEVAEERRAHAALVLASGAWPVPPLGRPAIYPETREEWWDGAVAEVCGHLVDESHLLVNGRTARAHSEHTYRVDREVDRIMEDFDARFAAEHEGPARIPWSLLLREAEGAVACELAEQERFTQIVDSAVAHGDLEDVRGDLAAPAAARTPA